MRSVTNMNFLFLFRYGWCGTTRKLVTGEVEENDGMEDQEVHYSSGWGVCGETCHTKHREVR